MYFSFDCKHCVHCVPIDRTTTSITGNKLEIKCPHCGYVLSAEIEIRKPKSVSIAESDAESLVKGNIPQNRVQANLALIDELRAKGLDPIIDESGDVLGYTGKPLDK